MASATKAHRARTAGRGPRARLRLRRALAREFIAMGKALGGGSGWVLLSWSPRDGKLVNQWAADHCHTLAGGQPILALDMYEHSYHIDYGAKAATYVDTFMNAIRWSNADKCSRADTEVIRHAPLTLGVRAGPRAGLSLGSCAPDFLRRSCISHGGR